MLNTMEAETFGQRLKRFREATGKSQRQLARETGLSNGTISQAEKDKLWIGQSPSTDIARRLAKALGVTLDDLAPDPEAEEGTDVVAESAPPAWRSLPFEQLADRIGAERLIEYAIELDQAVSAGTGDRAGIPQGLEDIEGIEAIPVEYRGKQQHYILRVTGDCMEPEVDPGDRVVFDREAQAENGDLVVAILDGEQGLVKRYDVRATDQYLLPLKGRPIRIDEHIEILGVVVEIRKRPSRKKGRR